MNISNRQVFEELVGNEIVRIGGLPPFYVSIEDRYKLWPENPHDMSKKGYTIKAQIRAKALLFGGFSRAEVISVEAVTGKPRITE